MDEKLHKFHCTCGETKKLITSSVSNLQSCIQDKFGADEHSHKIQLFLPEVDDYIEWDTESETMVASEPTSKMWKIVIEKSSNPSRGGGGGTAAQSTQQDRFENSRDEDGAEMPQTKLYVGNLDESVTRDDLEQLFEPFGTIVELDVLRNYGFVHFKDNAEAEKASKALDLTTYKDKVLKVQVSKSSVRHKPGMGKFTCYRCGKNGHWTKECPTRRPEERRGARGDRYGGEDPYPEYDLYYSRYPAAPPRDRYRPYNDPYSRRLPPVPDPYTDPYYARNLYGRSRDPYGPDYLPPRNAYGTSSRGKDA